MNLLVTLNRNYLTPLSVMLKSLMKSNPCGSFDLYVAHSSLKSEDFEKIYQSVDIGRVCVHSVKISPDLLSDAPVLKRISKETYYRLLLMDYLPETVDRILYIDPDTVIINDLSRLYNIDFHGKSLAAAGHTRGLCETLNRIRFNSPKSVRYFNAGVIMFNLEKIRQSVTSDDIFAYIEENKKRLFLADQDALNGIFGKDAVFIDERIYNLDEKTLKYNRSDIDFKWVLENTVIVHFNGKYKPWLDNYKGSLSPLWFKYKNIAVESSLAQVG